MRLHVLLVTLLTATPAFAQIAPSPGAPGCRTHNNRAWHSLWDPVRGCHYDHHHGDNPHQADDLFGTSLFNIMGGEVSHPWQSFNASGYENDLKHAGYFWHVRRNLQPQPGQTSWISAFRLMVHQHPTGRDAAVRFHSGVFEAITTDVDGDRGYIQIPGMWIDFGHLLVNGQRVLDVGPSADPGRHRQHGDSGTPQMIWYGATQATHDPGRGGRIDRGFVSISTSVHDVWDFTSASDPSGTNDFACYPNARCRNNATLLRPHLVVIHLRRPVHSAVDPDRDGIANWRGYTDRYGVPVEGCSSTGLDCVPVRLENIRTGVDYSCDHACRGSYRDHDILFGGQTSGWSQPVP